jgi:hypothetical protein
MATKAEWAKRVERWESSGLSAEKFARREGYKPKQLYWWRWKLRAERKRPTNAIVIVGVAPVTYPHREGGSDGDEGGVGRAGGAMGAQRAERREVRAA